MLRQIIKYGAIGIISFLVIGVLFLFSSRKGEPLASLDFPSPSGKLVAKVTDYIDSSSKNKWSEVSIQDYRVATIEGTSLIDSLKSNILRWKDEKNLIINSNHPQKSIIDSDELQEIYPGLSVEFQ